MAATKPADWFTADSHPLLAQYCRHIATANLIAAQIDAISPDQLAEKAVFSRYSSLLKMRTTETTAIVHLANAMRLTQLSRYKSETAATAHTNAGDTGKPWQAAN